MRLAARESAPYSEFSTLGVGKAYSIFFCLATWSGLYLLNGVIREFATLVLFCADFVLRSFCYCGGASSSCCSCLYGVLVSPTTLFCLTMLCLASPGLKQS